MTINIQILNHQNLNDAFSDNWDASYILEFNVTISKINQNDTNYTNQANIRLKEIYGQFFLILKLKIHYQMIF